MKIHFAGTESNRCVALVKEAGGERILQSAFYLRYKKEPANTLFKDFLLDSGGFTARNSGVEISVKQYSDFLNKYGVTYGFNLDVMDLKQSDENQLALQMNTATYIIPVFHLSTWLSDGLDRLKKMCDSYPYISLGGTIGKTAQREYIKPFFDACFKVTRDRVKVHGLGVNDPKHLNRYPFYSVDSTTWLMPHRFGNYLHFNQGHFVQLSSPKRGGKVICIEQLEQDKNTQLIDSIKATLKLEDYFTKVWEERGIKWV